MNKLNNKQELIKQMQDKQAKIDSCSIGQFTNTESVRNRAISLLGENRGLKFLAGITSAVSTNSNLAECTNTSIFNGALLGESLNLSPSPQLGHYYLVPYKKKDKQGNVVSVTAQFQLGYKGYIQLAIRSGQYKKINVIEVKEGEFVNYDMFDEEITLNPIKNYEQRKRAKTIGYYAMFEYLSGFRKCLYMSKEEMLEHADTYSQAFSRKSYELLQEGKIAEKDMWKYSSFWYKNFDEMAKKTMLRQLISKWGIMSVDIQKAFESDMSELNDEMQPNYIDDPTEIPQEPIQQEDIPEAEINEDKPQTEATQVDMNALLNN